MLTFLEAYEDAMINSNVTLDSDKIAFVKSNLTCDSLASEMMQSSSFTPKLINYSTHQLSTTAPSVPIFSKPLELSRTMTLCNGPSALLSPSLLRGQARAVNIAN